VCALWKIEHEFTHSSTLIFIMTFFYFIQDEKDRFKKILDDYKIDPVTGIKAGDHSKL